MHTRLESETEKSTGSSRPESEGARGDGEKEGRGGETEEERESGSTDSGGHGEHAVPQNTVKAILQLEARIIHVPQLLLYMHCVMHGEKLHSVYC